MSESVRFDIGTVALGTPISTPKVPIANFEARGHYAANDWRFTPGVYTPRSFMREISVLLESVILQLGPDPAGARSTREIFFESLRSSLSHEGREATLVLRDWKSGNPSEITKKALQVGKTLYLYAKEQSKAVPGDPNLTIYSPCEGHKWVPPAGQLLRSYRSSPQLMMLFNEWIHQITCLRNFLLAFENFEEVQLVLVDPELRGTRLMESYYAPLVALIQSDNLNHEHLFEISKKLTAPELPKGGFGFQYAGGTVLPALLFGKPDSMFVKYVPRIIDGARHGAILYQTDKGGLNSSGTNDLTLDGQIAATIKNGEATITVGRELAENTETLTLTGNANSKGSFSFDLGKIVSYLRRGN